VGKTQPRAAVQGMAVACTALVQMSSKLGAQWQPQGPSTFNGTTAVSLDHRAAKEGHHGTGDERLASNLASREDCQLLYLFVNALKRITQLFGLIQIAPTACHLSCRIAVYSPQDALDSPQVHGRDFDHAPLTRE